MIVFFGPFGVTIAPMEFKWILKNNLSSLFLEKLWSLHQFYFPSNNKHYLFFMINLFGRKIQCLKFSRWFLSKSREISFENESYSKKVPPLVANRQIGLPCFICKPWPSQILSFYRLSQPCFLYAMVPQNTLRSYKEN